MKPSTTGRLSLSTALLAAALAAGCPTAPPTAPGGADAGAPPASAAPPASTASAPPGSAAPPATIAGGLPSPETQLAVSGDLVVTLGDFDRAIRRLSLTAPGGAVMPLTLIRTPHFQWSLVRELLTLAFARREARQRGIAPTPEEVRAELEKVPGIAELMRLSPEERRARLEPRGLDDTDLLEIGADRLAVPALQSALVPDIQSPGFRAFWDIYTSRRRLRYIELHLTPTSQELDGFVTHQGPAIERYYKEHAARFATPGMRRVSVVQRHLAPNAAPEEEARFRRELEEVRSRVNDEGADFAALARQISDHPNAQDGGAIGWVLRPQLPEAFDAPVGRVSEVQRFSEGLRVLLVHEARPGQERPLDGPLRREIAALLLRERGPNPDQLQRAKRLLAAWREAGRDGGPKLDALLKDEQVTLQETPSFIPSQDPFVPGIGDAPSLVGLIPSLSPERWLLDQPVVVSGRVLIIGLGPDDAHRAGELDDLTGGPAGEDMLREARGYTWDKYLQEHLRLGEININLNPLKAVYGLLSKEDAAQLQRQALEEEARKEQEKQLEGLQADPTTSAPSLTQPPPRPGSPP